MKAGEIVQIIKKHSKSFTVVSPDVSVEDVQSALDLMATARYYDGGDGIIFHSISLGDQFFNLRTKFAGALLQKFVNYNMRVGIVGDFSQYDSKALRDFIYECNQGRQICFKSTIDEAVAALSE
ncbi:DUF4180 domain-containing protein [Fusibacter paucivorans]|uniref:DUF4180 domain-containing protein n=1 Tax=Fusibacter paucivorans TaxID=76009 RepID=A0ABS5PRH4_9FIRM|nr:DUF4180 domain-containing protein [Fusibacter paucivorans]MBS7527765.1 DUF4180 domain-containing protein [Fusibacter paucivorans]